MADTIIESIFQGFMTQAATITTTNGYNYSLGPNVERAILDNEFKDLPNIIIIPGEEETERLHGKIHVTRMLIVEAKAAIGTANPSVVQEKLLGDVVKAFTRPDQVTWRAKVLDVNYIRGGPRVHPEAGHKITGVYALFAVLYKVVKGNPYAQ